MLWNVESSAANKPASVQAVIDWFASILKGLLDFIAKEEGWIAE